MRYNELSKAVLEIVRLFTYKTGNEPVVIPEAEYTSIIAGNACLVLDQINNDVQIATGNPSAWNETGLAWAKYDKCNINQYIKQLAQ